MARCTCTCGTRYKVPDSSLGKKSKCKKCGTIFMLEAEEEGILALAPEAEDDHVSAFMMQAQAAAAAAAKAYHEEAEEEPKAERPRPVGALARSYGSDVLWTFLFLSKPGNLISFIMTSIAMGLLAPLAAMVPLIGLFCSIVVSGWYAAYRLEILRDAASGQDDLPTLGFSRDLWEDAIEPLLQWIGSWLIVLLPAVAFLVFSFQQGRIDGGDAATALFGGITGLRQAGSGDMLILAFLVWAGLFAWPIVVLCIALGGVECLVRVDRIALTVVRTLPGYAVTLALLLAAVALKGALAGQMTGAAAGAPASTAAQTIGVTIALYASLTCVGIYADIVVMRLIGLYYHHFKRKFAWEWE